MRISPSGSQRICRTEIDGRHAAIQCRLRPGELVALDVEYLDLDAGTVYLTPSFQRDDPLPATLGLRREAVRLLSRYLRDRWKKIEAVIGSSDRMTTPSLERLVKTIAVEAGIKPQMAEGGTGDLGDITPYTLPHLVAYRIV